MRKKYWLWFGLIFMAGNIVLSIFAYNNPNIRHPVGLSDLAILSYPNFLLGLPAHILVTETISSRLISEYYRNAYHNNIVGIPTIDEYGKDTTISTDKLYGTNIFIELFITLTIYWFIVGSLLGLLYGKIKSRKAV